MNGLRRTVVESSLLKRDLWSTGVNRDTTPELRDHRRLLIRLLASRQPGQAAPWLFTLNYDLAIEWAAESIELPLVNGFSGLHDRQFAPRHFDLGLRSVIARGEAQFGAYYLYLAKLHGSLSWIEDPDCGVRELPCRAIWPSMESFLGSRDKTTWPGLIVFPMASKYEQATGFVYGEMFREFGDFLARPQSLLLVSGYSFSDEHVNRVILAGLQNPTLQVVIYRPELTWSAAGDDFETDPNRTIGYLRSIESPQVTFVGGGPAAYFGSLVRDLPEPAMLDETASVGERVAAYLREERTRATSASRTGSRRRP